MKILFFVYPSAFQNPGGGEVQLLKTKEALEALGVKVRFFDQWRDNLNDFNILHVFGSVKDCVGLMQTAKNKKIKVALSPIFWSSFKRACGESDNIKVRGEFLLRHLVKVALPRFPSARRKTMSIADILLPNSHAEKLQLQRLFAMPKEKILVVPNGVDEKFSKSTADIFTKKFNLSNFILTVGRIEPRKNQLNLIKALKVVNKDLVIVGDPVSDYPQYYKACKDAAGERVRFLGGFSHESELLSSAYAACDCFIAPGWFETPGLAALEAGLAGAKLAVTKYGCTKEYFLNHAEYFDPSNKNEIARAVISAAGKERSPELKEHIIRNFTWERVANATLKAYEKILQK